MFTLADAAAEVKPADQATVPAASLVAVDNDSWAWSDAYANLMAERAADASDLDHVCDGLLPF